MGILGRLLGWMWYSFKYGCTRSFVVQDAKYTKWCRRKLERSSG